MSDFTSGNAQKKQKTTKIVSMETALASFNPCEDDPHGSTSMPIYQTATFKQPGATDFGKYDYTRSGNPTRDALQKQIAALEGVEDAATFCFTSGMAALAAVVKLAKSGDEIIANDDSYGGT
jgi:cystathionine beta-lyase